ncbi:hypothetical protein [Pontibacter sp. G13]|uniref:hypothetical protein n=1 Tax=Pontibacter sp. G13 TaxID=3074898 RepID=UPI0028899D54|nr:hypothetical protein [Pontibacter sp. G13]WNJ20472.1 hypothetical protein RJD25_08320 [Pontibacter sp. G13]
MKAKLAKFRAYCGELMPHEPAYLAHIQQFADADNLRILQQVEELVARPDPHRELDASIDKRKYSRWMKWAQTKLSQIDVDRQFDWISQMERSLMTDAITPTEEKELLRAIKAARTSDYYFVKFYELAVQFRQFLLIRMRYKAHATVHQFLDDHQAAFERSREVFAQLHRVSQDITAQYSSQATESRQWEEWLNTMIQDESLDGLNRYMAIVRLTFIYMNYRQLHKQLALYDRIDGWMRQGMFYSRRILANYYANRLTLHAQLGDLARAEQFGYLAIKYKGSDYLLYVNKLSAILLRRHNQPAAMELMRSAFPELRNSRNAHERVGFASFYIRCLIESGLPAEAEQYAESFLRGYSQEVMAHRWHLFFTSYLKALLVQEKSASMLQLVNKHKLMNREHTYRHRPNYLPTLRWYVGWAQYHEGKLSQRRLIGQIQDSLKDLQRSPRNIQLAKTLVDELKPFAPEIVGAIQWDELLTLPKNKWGMDPIVELTHTLESQSTP